jgi:hypothetical protein
MQRVWNRVFLLAAGVASGWTLVLLWTVPPAEVGTHRIRLILGLGIGAAQITLLAVASMQAGLAALLVFAFSALVAYAANAKRVSKAPEPALWRRPSLAQQVNPRILVLLAVDGEPATYSGPQYWAQAYRQHQARGEPPPQWFMRPLAYSHIRAAYAAMGDQHPLDAALDRTTAALGAHLGHGYAVRHAYLRCHPTVSRILVDLADEGFRRIILVPLVSAADDAQPALRQAVSDSRVREFGVQIAYTPGPTQIPGGETLYADHLLMLAKGNALPMPADVTADQIESVASCVTQSAGELRGRVRLWEKQEP